MPAFFDEIEPFLGDGSKNEAGETLEEFLEKYDPYKYRNPCSTVDMVVFSYSGEMASRMDQMKVLLIKRKNHPSIGTWAMPLPDSAALLKTFLSEWLLRKGNV